MYVEYESNNSGGSWWLEDSHWKALEAAGWKVLWASLEEKLRGTEGLDQRWVSIGATDFQTGLMALTRAVAQPTFF